MSILNPFQLLELNVISAQDLAPVSRSMRAYAVAWVHPDRKLSTRVDTHGHNNPTWNDKFVFRVDDEFLHSDTSAVMIEIYALHWFKDIHVGTVRILVGNLIPTPPRPHQFSHQQAQVGMRFVALQVRRPSGRPQGILNIGVALLHSSMRSMPLYSQLSTSAIGYRNLMGEEDPYHHHHNNHSHGTPTVTTTKPKIRRSKSDTSSMMGSDLRGSEMMGRGSDKKSKASSMVNGAEVSKQKKKGKGKPSSMISGSVTIKRKGKTRKASSMISGSGLEEEVHKNGKTGKSSSIIGTPKKDKTDISSTISGSEIYPIEPPPLRKVVEKEKKVPRHDSPKPKAMREKPILNTEIYESPQFQKPQEKPIPKPEIVESPRRKAAQETPNSKFEKMSYATPLRTPQRGGGGTARATPMHEKYGTPRRTTPLHGKSHPKFNEFNYTTPRKSFLGGAFLTESELGPSPSEVAAQMANQKVDDGNESSIIGGMSLNGSVEGLQSKLERWRTELPPVYDHGGELSSFKSTETRRERRHSDGGGLFSCFSNICGCECSIVCGGDSAKAPKKTTSGRVIRSPSADNVSFV